MLLSTVDVVSLLSKKRLKKYFVEKYLSICLIYVYLMDFPIYNRITGVGIGTQKGYIGVLVNSENIFSSIFIFPL